MSKIETKNNILMILVTEQIRFIDKHTKNSFEHGRMK